MSKKISFEEKLKRLEEISIIMQNGEISLDESVKLYDESSEIIKELKEELSKAGEKVKILTDEQNGEIKNYELTGEE